MRILCVDAQMSTEEVCARPWSAPPEVRRILCAMAKRTATDREMAYRQEVYAYVQHVMIERGWSQSELARQVGVHPSSINKVVGRKHSIDYSHLLVLADVSEIPLPDSVTITYKSLSGAARVPDPLEAKIREIGRQLEERPPEERKAFVEELRRLAKVK